MSEIKKIYFMNFLVGLSNAATVTYTLYFLSNGLSQAQIGQLFGFFLICLAVFEIPTGGLADMFGHKASVATGLLFQGLSFLVFFLYPNYFGFLIGMGAAALGIAFQSGATSSLTYELLRKKGLGEDFQKVIGRVSGYFLIATIIASPIGSLIYKFYPEIPYLFAFLVFIPAFFMIYSIKWEFVKKSPKFSTYIKTITDGILLTVKNQILIALVIIGFALTLNRLVFNQNISQPYIVGVGVDIAYVGFVAAVFSAVLAFVSINTYKITKKIGRAASLLLTIMLPCFALIVLSFTTTLFAIPIILVFLMGHALRDPVMAHIEQDVLDSDKRSTMASTSSFLISVCAGLLMPYWGQGIDVFGIHKTLLLLSIFSLSVGGIGLWLFRHKIKLNV